MAEPYTGKVVDADGENWKLINSDLKAGRRSLSGGQSLAGVLAEHRGAPNPYPKKSLQIEEILAWADAYHAATGRWPGHESGLVDSAPARPGGGSTTLCAWASVAWSAGRRWPDYSGNTGVRGPVIDPLG